MGDREIVQAGVRENTAYVAGNDVFASAITPTFRNGFVRVTYVTSASANVLLRLIGAATTNVVLGSGAGSLPNGANTYDFAIRPQAGAQAITYNIRFDANVTIVWLLVEEISGGD